MIGVKLFVALLLINTVLSKNLCSSKCTCNPKVLKCTGLTQTDIESDLFQNSITNTLERINITGWKIQELPKYMLGKCAGDSSYRLDKLKILDLQDNEINKINGQTLHCVPNLEELILANNQWNISRDHTHVFTSVPHLKKLNMSYAFYNPVYSEIQMVSLQMLFLENQLNELEVLALDHNGFSVFNKDATNAICTLPKLRILNLAYNLLQKLSLYHTRCLPDLEFLDLSYNSIMTFEPEHEHKGLMYSLDYIQSSSENLTVNFFGNEFQCDCGLSEFHNWLRRTDVHVLKKQKLICRDGKHFNQSIVSLRSTDFDCLSCISCGSLGKNADNGINAATIGILATLSISFVVISLVCVVVVFKRRKNQAKHNTTTKMTEIIKNILGIRDPNWKPLRDQGNSTLVM